MAVVIIFLFTIVYYLPIFLNPNLILNRGNDLQEQFWPVFYFIKQQVLQNHTLPLWNNIFLSGLPLLPDPQFSLFYMPNWLFVIFPTGSAFIIYFFIHSLIGGLAMYYLTKKVFQFSTTVSLFSSFMFISTPKFAGFIEEGHMGLLASYAWLPLVPLCLYMLNKKPGLKWSIIYAISLAAIFFAHTVIFILVCFSSIILFFILLISSFKKKFVLFTVIGLLLGVGLTAVTLLPQLEWIPQTNRYLLLEIRDIYPKWDSIKEFVTAIVAPITFGVTKIWQMDSEKWIVIGITPSILSLIGFYFVGKKIKALITTTILLVLLVALNNSSPIYKILISQDSYALMRVSTRVWFVIILLVIFLSSLVMEKFYRSKKIGLVYLIGAAVIFEQLALSYIYMMKPIQQNPNLAPQAVYDFLKKDSEIFRVYCVNRCLSQQKAAANNLQLVDGYNTLQQKNYLQQSWQLTGAYWNYYSLSTPPVGIYTFDKPQPDPVSLGEFNTKYIISPYELNNKNFIKEEKIDGYYIYKNSLFKPRAYFMFLNNTDFIEAPMTKYAPNEIVVDTSKTSDLTSLTLSEVYNSNWKAFDNGRKEIKIQEKPNTLRLVDIKGDTRNVVFKYEPESFKIGKMITLTTILIILLISISPLKRLRKV